MLTLFLSPPSPPPPAHPPIPPSPHPPPPEQQFHLMEQPRRAMGTGTWDFPLFPTPLSPPLSLSSLSILSIFLLWCLLSSTIVTMMLEPGAVDIGGEGDGEERTSGWMMSRDSTLLHLFCPSSLSSFPSFPLWRPSGKGQISSSFVLCTLSPSFLGAGGRPLTRLRRRRVDLEISRPHPSVACSSARRPLQIRCC